MATNEVEVLRLRMGSLVVGGSIFAVVICLAFVIAAPNALPNVADKVALMGSVTTFLGAVVGVFFGVNSSGSHRAQNAADTIEQNKTVTTLAAAATTATVSAAQSVANTHAFLTRMTSAPSTMGFTADMSPPPPQSPPPPPADMVRGDSEETPQALTLPRDHLTGIETFSSPHFIHIDQPVPAADVFDDDALKVASIEAAHNVSRATDRPRVTEYLRLLDLDFLDGHGVPTRFCAAGLTWSACRAYCDANAIFTTDANRLAVLRSVLPDIRKRYFMPSASCQVIVDDARKRGTFLDRSNAPKPGFIVFFNWDGASHAEHVGWVESLDGAVLHTIEFNTTAVSGPNEGDGGCVCKKARALKFVVGYAQTY